MGDLVGLEIKGGPAVRAMLAARPKAIKRAGAVIARRAAVRLQAAVRRNASGPPGPNVVTGEYRDRIVVLQLSEGDVTTYAVATTHPAAMRLEYGFVGTDALGRTYAQPPRPHWRPASIEVAKTYRAEMGKL